MPEVTLKLGNHRKLLVTCRSLSRAVLLPPFKYVLTRGVSQFVLTFNFYFQAANISLNIKAMNEEEYFFAGGGFMLTAFATSCVSFQTSKCEC